MDNVQQDSRFVEFEYIPQGSASAGTEFGEAVVFSHYNSMKMLFSPPEVAYILGRELL